MFAVCLCPDQDLSGWMRNKIPPLSTLSGGQPYWLALCYSPQRRPIGRQPRVVTPSCMSPSVKTRIYITCMFCTLCWKNCSGPFLPSACQWKEVIKVIEMCEFITLCLILKKITDIKLRVSQFGFDFVCLHSLTFINSQTSLFLHEAQFLNINISFGSHQ